MSESHVFELAVGFGEYLGEHLPQHLGDRIEGGVLEKRSGAGFDPGMRCAGYLFAEALHQSRLADAG